MSRYLKKPSTLRYQRLLRSLKTLNCHKKRLLWVKDYLQSLSLESQSLTSQYFEIWYCFSLYCSRIGVLI